MKIEVQRDSFSSALALAARFSSAPKSTLPIIEHIKITPGDNELQLEASDFEIGIQTRTPAKCQPGPAFLVGKTVIDLFKRLTDENVTLGVADNSSCLTVLAGRSRSNLKLLGGVDQFPESMISAAKVQSSRNDVPAKELLAGIAKALSAIDPKNSGDHRPFLGSVNFVSNEETLALQGTDIYRFARIELPYGGPTHSTLVPVRILNELKSFAATEESLSIIVCDRAIIFRCSRGDISSRLLTGAYPDAREYLKLERSIKVEFEREWAIEALSRAQLVAQVVSVSSGENGVVLAAVGAETGDFNEEVDARWEGPTNVTIRFHIGFLVQGLKAFRGESVRFSFDNTPNSPLIVTDPEDPTFRYLTMPTMQKD